MGWTTVGEHTYQPNPQTCSAWLCHATTLSRCVVCGNYFCGTHLYNRGGFNHCVLCTAVYDKEQKEEEADDRLQ